MSKKLNKTYTIQMKRGQEYEEALDEFIPENSNSK